MKDNFSGHSDSYSKFRPGYRSELISYLVSLTKRQQCAWDCGTGNGQLAVKLAAYFDEVYATDLSENQLRNATPKNNIQYRTEQAEKTSFDASQFDLITVAQAIHWFDFDAFYAEVRRTLREDGVLAVVGYALLQVDESTDKVIQKLYSDIVGPYWDPERKYIEDLYKTIPFPFHEEKTPVFHDEYQWTLEQLMGYLETWSAVKHYMRDRGENPITLISDALKQSWEGFDTKTVTFPIMLRVGRL